MTRYKIGTEEFRKQEAIDKKVRMFWAVFFTYLFFVVLFLLAVKANAQTTLTSNKKIFTVIEQKKEIPFNELSFRDRFRKRCHEEFDERMCQWAEAQIMHEGTFNAHRWAEYAEGYCAFGMYQNNVCIHQGWAHDEAKYIYGVLTTKSPVHEYERLKKFDYLLDENWQINSLLQLYKNRIARQNFSNRWCRNKVILGEKMHQDIYAAIRLHNWNAGDQYVTKIAKMRQELFFNNQGK